VGKAKPVSPQRARKRAPREQTTKLTAERRAAILQHLKKGQRRIVVCDLVGISTRTLRHWLQQGKEGHSRYADFRREALAAEAGSEEEAVSNIRTAGRKDWRADAWWLERTRADVYGDKVRIQLEGELDKILGAAEEVLDDETYTRFLAALETRLPKARAAGHGGEDE